MTKQTNLVGKDDMSEELKPCAHCGGSAEILVYDCHQINFYCTECGATSGSAATKAEAIAAWNRRSIPEGQRDKVIEQCAQVCDGESARVRNFAGPMAVAACGTLADKIRAMKGKP